MSLSPTILQRHAREAKHTSHTVIIYGKTWCPGTLAAIDLMKKQNKRDPAFLYKYYDIGKIPAYHKKILKQHHFDTIPAIFFSMKSKLDPSKSENLGFLGGYQELTVLLAKKKQ
jgi:glutaredoxin